MPRIPAAAGFATGLIATDSLNEWRLEEVLVLRSVRSPTGSGFESQERDQAIYSTSSSSLRRAVARSSFLACFLGRQNRE